MRLYPGVRTLLAGVALMLPTVAAAASFDCKKAATVTEKAICADPALSRLDEQVAESFRAAQGHWAAGNWSTFIRSEQRWWLKDRDRNCKADRACLTRDYELRLAFLRNADLKWSGRYVAGRCPADGLYLDVGPSYPAAGVSIELYVCPNPAGNMLIQAEGVPDAQGRLVVQDVGCRREFRFTQDTVTLVSTGGARCGVSWPVDRVYRRDPAKSPYLSE
jgi:uncharacterized protein